MPTPQEQAAGLIADLMKVATHLLREFGEFHPFGGYLSPSLEMTHVGFDGEGSGSERERGLRESFLPLVESGRAIAVGIACDVAMPGENAGSGVRVFVEHRDWIAAYDFHPYELVDDEPKFAENFLRRARPYYWPPPEQTQ